MTLGEFRHKPGAKLIICDTPFMVLSLCAGMKRGDMPFNGSETTIPVVNLETGRTSFESVDLEVVTAK